MKPLGRLLRSVAKPFLVLAPVAAALVATGQQYQDLRVFGEPGEILLAGLAGFWAARRYPRDQWSMQVLAGTVAAVLVAVVRVALVIYLGDTAVLPPATGMARAAVAGVTGALLSRLLRQRVTL